MNRSIIWILAGVLICLVAGCDKNGLQHDPRVPDAMVTYIKAGNDEGTKGSVDNTTARFSWNTGDTIAVYTTTGYKLSNPLENTYNATNDATFVLEGVEESTRDHFAFFPASLVHGSIDGIKPNCADNHTADNLVVRLRGSYTLSEVQDEVSPTPMIATNAPNGDLSFKSLCPLLRITVVNIPNQTKCIEFDFNGKKVQGEFHLTSVSPGSSAITTCTTTEADDIITVYTPDLTAWVDQLVINLPVPAGTYDKVTVTAYDFLPSSIISNTTTIRSGGWTPTRKSSKKHTVVLPVFSVSASKKVAIAPGNLQYDRSSGTMSFMEHQYDRVETHNMDVGNRYQKQDIVSLFGWATSSSPGSGFDPGWRIHWPYSTDNEENTTDYPLNPTGYGPTYTTLFPNLNDGDGASLYGDWGIPNPIWYGAIRFYPATWRTPTGDEWAYLIGGRADNYRYANGIIHDVEGVLIFPDGFDPSNLGIVIPHCNEPLASPDYIFTQYSDAEWAAMEASGVVFLPVAGQRNGTIVDRITMHNAGGFYWSTTASSISNAKGFIFQKKAGSHNYGVEDIKRSFGCSVRLIRDIN